MPLWKRRAETSRTSQVGESPQPPPFKSDPEPIRFNVRSHIFRRWVHFLVLIVILTLLGVFTLSLRGKVSEWAQPFFSTTSPWIRHITIIGLCSLMMFFSVRLLRPSASQLNWFALYHPPTWLAALCALVCVCVADQRAWVGPAGYHGTFEDWVIYLAASASVVRLLAWSGQVETRTSRKVNANSILSQKIKNYLRILVCCGAGQSQKYMPKRIYWECRVSQSD
jgi:hypothetical protein